MTEYYDLPISALNKLLLKYKDDLVRILGTDEYSLSIYEAGNHKFEDKNMYYKFEFRYKKDLVSMFSLVPMINCCGIVVSTSAHVLHPYRNRGIGALLNKVRIDLAKELGYGLIISTTVESNEPQDKIIKKNNWITVSQFKNPRTHNIVKLNAIKIE